MERPKANFMLNVIAAVVYGFLVSVPVRARMVCNDNYSGQCKIYNLEITLHEAHSLKFPVHENIQLINANVEYLSPQVLERMKWISKLTIMQGRVGRIYLKPDLQHLSVIKSQTLEVIIGAENNENLEELSIVNNDLKTVPENIEKLKALTMVELSGNKIEVVDMSKFHGLENLTSIDLSNNKLYYLPPVKEVELMRLEALDLSNNYLTELDFRGWNMPSLRTLKLFSNRLSYLINLKEETFPSLTYFHLAYNLWDCRWWDQFSAVHWNITTTRQSQLLETIQCTKSTQLSPATYRKLKISDVRSTGFQLDDKDQLEAQINGMMDASQDQSNRIESLAASVAKQAEQLGEANTKLEQQQALIGELLGHIESLTEQMQQLVERTQDVPTGRGLATAKGLREKLIREIAELIRNNLHEEE